jgi:DMSO/TMAO reductase YedYZ molybdopterin-dependent catalytic subunit
VQPGTGPSRVAIAGVGAVVGIVTAVVALGVAQLIAAILASPIGEPIAAVGEMSINHAPAAVKDFAIREFGSNDKTVLVWGIRAVLIIFAVVIGVLAVRKLWLGLIGLAVFAVVGVYAALSQPTAKGSDVLPTVIGAIVAAFAMRYFSGVARRLAEPRSAPWAGAAVQPRPGAQPRPGVQPRPGAQPPAQPGQAQPGQAQPGPAQAGPAQAGPPQPGPEQPPRAISPGASWRPADPPLPAEAAPASAAPASAPASAWRSGRAGPVRRRPEPGVDRRKFLLSSAIVAGVSLVTYAGGSWLANTRDVNAIQRVLKLPAPARAAPPLPPGTDFHIPGLSSFVTPNSKFYRVDTAIVLPEILPAHWQLRIHGMVRKEVVLTFADLLKRPLIEDWITLCCVSNPVSGPYVGNAKWLGASLRSLLQEAGIKSGADQLLCTSSDGFTSGTPVQTAMDGRDALLAVAMNGQALPVEHGFPARLVIPGLYGYVSACKWIVDIEVTTYAANQAYWVPRGWAPVSPIKTESRIDVPAGVNPVQAGKQTSIAGVAWAQHKGIDAVEVRIANGPWHEARLAAVPGIDCWRQWVYDWDINVAPGNYLIEARATDDTGYTQTSLQAQPAPNGASGYPSVLVNVVS